MSSIFINPVAAAAIKIHALQAGKRLFDVAIAAKYEYPYFIQTLNGFKSLPPDFETRVEKVFAKWEKEKTAGYKIGKEMMPKNEK